MDTHGKKVVDNRIGDHPKMTASGADRREPETEHGDVATAKSSREALDDVVKAPSVPPDPAGVPGLTAAPQEGTPRQETVCLENTGPATSGEIEPKPAAAEPLGPQVDDPASLQASTAAQDVDAAGVPLRAKWTRPQAPQRPWVYKPVPEGHHKHDESFAMPPTTSAEGWPIIGARVRGKLHKQNGTNCDDWFEVARAGSWTLIAVSDGGGSYRLSRVGAKTACKSAIGELHDALISVSHESLANGEPLEKSQLYLKARKAIFDAMARACDSIADAVAEERHAIAEAIKSAKRVSHEMAREVQSKCPEPAERDFYCTLLLCLHTQVTIAGKAHSLVMGCSVGDGMIAAIPRNVRGGARSPVLLMKADSGEHSSETVFLSPSLAKESILDGKLYTKLFQSPQCIVVMTDGVADDYFPQEKMLANLYGDLVLNRIIAAPPSEPDQIQNALSQKAIAAVDELSRLELWQSSKRLVGENDVRDVLCASTATLASALNTPVEEVANSNALLRAGAVHAECPLSDASDPSGRLMEWLDSYYAPTSFDDRTLVILDEGDYA